MNWEVVVHAGVAAKMVIAQFRHEFDAHAFALQCNEVTNSDDYTVAPI